MTFLTSSRYIINYSRSQQMLTLQLRGRIKLTPCFCMAHKLRWIFTSLNGWKKNQKKYFTRQKLCKIQSSVSIKLYISLIEVLWTFLLYYISTYMISPILSLVLQSLNYFIYYLALYRTSVPNLELCQNPRPLFNTL